MPSLRCCTPTTMPRSDTLQRPLQRSRSRGDDAYDDSFRRFRDAGAIPPLVAALGRDAESGVARVAVDALSCLVCRNDENRQAAFEASGVRPLVALLWSGNKSEAAGRAPRECWGILHTTAIMSLKHSATALAPFTPLVRSPCWSTCSDPTATLNHSRPRTQRPRYTSVVFPSAELRKAVVDAGSVGPLVSLLRFEAQAAIDAAGALANLSCDASYAAAVLDALPNHMWVPDLGLAFRVRPV